MSNKKFEFGYSAFITLVCIIISGIFALTNSRDAKTINELTNKLKQYENINSPFKGEIDSLKANIAYKDSIIKQIKIEYVKDVEWVKNMPDSAAVALFYQLVWAEDNAV